MTSAPNATTPIFHHWVFRICVLAVALCLGWAVFASVSPNQSPPLFNAALKALAKGNIGEAESLFDNALKTRNHDTTTLQRTVLAWRRHQRWDKAAQYAQLGVSAERPRSAEARAWFYESLAQTYMDWKPSGWQEEAVKAARQAYSAAPYDPGMQNLFGYLLADLRSDPQSLGQADTLLSKALETVGKSPRTPEVRLALANIKDSVGWLRFKQKRYGEAIDLLSQAASEHLKISASPDPEAMKTIYYHLGATYRQAGRPAEAQIELKKSLAYDSNFAEAKAELQAVNAMPSTSTFAVPPSSPPNP